MISLQKLFFIGACAVFLTASAWPLTNDGNLRAREFVVMGYQGLQLELRSGTGPYLTTLFDLLGIPSDMEAKTTEQLKVLLKANTNIMDFADRVVELGQATRETAQIIANTPVPSGPGIYSGDTLVNALEHLTRGMAITVTLKTGEQLKGLFGEYSGKRLWLRGASKRTVHIDDILAVEAPEL